ncbi:hypothetical protein VNO77_15228 [Canavalia gladiata]|uniref:Serine-threonine/tyrosine-protein kinase catalytic domain-containing protein n=1 Tax=Canavalia gladiata TaxID=3824 RepID=A0AAN9M447_CANGL
MGNRESNSILRGAKIFNSYNSLCTKQFAPSLHFYSCSPLQTGKLTLQSDVYGFGVVLLEILTGRRIVDLNQDPSDQNLVLHFIRPCCRLYIVEGLIRGHITAPKGMHVAIHLASAIIPVGEEIDPQSPFKECCRSIYDLVAIHQQLQSEIPQSRIMIKLVLNPKLILA